MTTVDDNPLARWEAECEPVVANTTEHEDQVLATLLYAHTAPLALLERLAPKHFYRPANAEIWRVVREHLLAEVELDIVRVMDRLRETAPTAVSYLHRIVSTGPARAACDLTYLADKIIDGFRARTVQERLVRAQQHLAAGHVDQACDVMAGGQDEFEPDRYGWTVDEIHAELVAEAEQPHLVVPTPWPTVNSALYGGLAPGRLYVLAGVPGTGKTMAAQCVATHAAATGTGAMVVSLEMSRTELLRRLYATGAKVPMAEVMRHDFALLPESFARVEEFRATVRAAHHNLIVNDQEGLTVEAVRDKARIACRRHDIGVIAVDYLQLVDVPTARTEVEQVKHVARHLKLMSKELRRPVLALAQPNRNAAYQGRKLEMADLHGSSEIEKAADAIILLNREDGKPGSPAEVVEFAIVKNRQGRTDSVRMVFDGARQQFGELPR